MRKIIHVDADCFYAAIELRRHPELQGKAIAVGGSPESRGVIATCNYQAREYGIHSAMPSARAVKLCPGLVILHPDFNLYRQVSKQIHAIFRRFTSVIEPIALDEAYLDVSECQSYQGSATLIAEEIRHQIKTELHITASAGIAENKFLAKVASDWNKPDGQFVIRPEQVEDFVRDLPVKKINGVGKVTNEKMARLGIHTCGDLQQFSMEQLEQHFGRWGKRLFSLARGQDDRPVQTSRERKSLSVERTFEDDVSHQDDIKDRAIAVYEELLKRSRKLDASQRVHKRFVKIRFHDFDHTSVEELVSEYEADWKDRERFLALTDLACRRRQNKPIRLLGMGIRLKSGKTTKDEQHASHEESANKKDLNTIPHQLTLF